MFSEDLASYVKWRLRVAKRKPSEVGRAIGFASGTLNRKLQGTRPLTSEDVDKILRAIGEKPPTILSPDNEVDPTVYPDLARSSRRFPLPVVPGVPRLPEPEKP
jgi:hypothetical protein